MEKVTPAWDAFPPELAFGQHEIARSQPDPPDDHEAGAVRRDTVEAL
jgi:hypothetical protein